MDLRWIAALCRVLTITATLTGTVAAQQIPDPPPPYAAIDHSRIAYAGPDRAHSRDLKDPEIRIGLLVPLQGPRKAEGEASLLAARLALEDLTAQQPSGWRLAIAAGDESGPWGRASSEVARLILDEDAVAVVTSMEGGAAHLAEQIGTKIGIPILTLATDSTTTEINLPWIFRLSPDDRAQARTFARAIYSKRGYKRVLLIAERDHDGREGGTEFEKAVAELGAPAPERLNLNPDAFDPVATVAAIRSHAPQAVVIWAGARAARQVLPALGHADLQLPAFLCQKAVAEGMGKEAGKVWTILRPGGNPAARRSFEERFRSCAGSLPTPEAEGVYDAVSLIVVALRRSGPNRARLRDRLATTKAFAGISGRVCFDGAGNNVEAIQLTPLPGPDSVPVTVTHTRGLRD